MDEPPHILVVEDNEDDVEAIRRSFARRHLLDRIAWCQNGRDALDYLLCDGAHAGRRGGNPQLILLDLNMPGLDGRRMLEIIKGNEKLRTVPVVVLTTSADNRDVERCYHLGASTYIQKPVSFDRLTEAMRTMTDYWFGIALLPQRGV
ncbi:MAG: response regulator [Xanthobacteraceae bacterium]|jgi:two-component system response regulator